jgi:hypothetical protein
MKAEIINNWDKNECVVRVGVTWQDVDDMAAGEAITLHMPPPGGMPGPLVSIVLEGLDDAKEDDLRVGETRDKVKRLPDVVERPQPGDVCARCEHSRAHHYRVDETCSYLVSFPGTTCTCPRFETTDRHIARMTANLERIEADRHRHEVNIARMAGRVRPPVPQPGSRIRNPHGTLALGKVCPEAADLPQTRAELFEIMSKNIRVRWELISYEEVWDEEDGHYHVKLSGRESV